MLKRSAWENTLKTLKNLSIWIWAFVSFALFISVKPVGWLLSELQKAGFISVNIESIEQVSQSILFEPVAVVVPSSLTFFSWILSVLGGSPSVSETLLKLSQNVLGATTWYLAGMAVANLLCENYSIAALLAFSLALSFLFTFLSHRLETSIVSNKAVMPLWKGIRILVFSTLLWISVLLFLILGSAAPDNLIYFVPLLFCALFSFLIALFLPT